MGSTPPITTTSLVDVAQLVERQTVNLEVRGSNPLIYPVQRSFLIHNFLIRSRNFRWTPKTYLMWIAYNLPILFFYSLQITRGSWATTLNLSNKHVFQTLMSYGFRETFLKHVVRAVEFNNHPARITLTTSLKYLISQTGLTLASRKKVTLVPLRRFDKIVFNKYHLLVPCILTRSSSKLYKTFLVKSLLFSLLTWNQWNNNIGVTAQHTHLFSDLYLLRFINVYFFKIFNF